MIVGKAVPRVDARDKVLGRAKFIDDLKFPAMLHCAVLRSPLPFAEILELDSSEALAIPGVEFIVTAKDVPGSNLMPLVKADHPFLAEGLVRFYGEAVAAVAAESLELAELAVKKIKVKYRELTPVLSIEEALSPHAPLIHKDGNLYKTYRVIKGELEKGFAQADLIIENQYRTPYQEHAYLEPNGVIAVPGNDEFTVYGSIQCPFYVQKAVAEVLGFPLSRVRIIQAETGGGFGGKEDVPSLVAGIASLLAFKTQKPVKYILSRSEDLMATSKRHPAIIRCKTGAKKSGELTAMEVEYLIDGGAYTTLSTIVLWRGVVHAAGPYRIPNVKVVGKAVATNKVPCGAYRGFGTPQVIFACESQMDELAEKLNIDPLEFRKINALKLGDQTSTGQVLTESVGFLETMEKAAQSSGWKEKRALYAAQEGELRRGIGISTFLYGVGLGAGGAYLARAGAFVQVLADGSVQAAVGTVEMGQGMKTVLSQILAEELGCEFSAINLMAVDTSRVPDSGPTVASRSTVMSGNALRDAAQKIKANILEALAKHLKIPPENLSLSEGKVLELNQKELLSFKEAIAVLSKKRLHLAAQGWYKAPATTFKEESGQGDIYFAYTWVTKIAEVEVDTRTGEVEVLKITSAHDIGKAINPVTLEGQIEGGLLQGLGYATCEDFIYEKGKPITLDFSTYIIPTSLDAPEVTPIIVEHPYSQGPFGAKGIGETPLMGVAPAITNAIKQAAGVRVKEIPAKPELILALLEAKLKGGAG